MKKTFLCSLLFMGCLCLTTSCGDDDDAVTPTTPTGPGGDNSQGSIIVASDQQAQQELDRVGKALLNKVDANKFKPLINLAQYCEDTFYEDDSYYDPYYPYASPSQALRMLTGELKTMARGNIARLTNRRMITQLYQLTDYYATYTWSEAAREWIETSNSNALTYKFQHNGVPCECTVTASGQTYSWTWKEDGDKTTVKIPENVTATLTEGGNTLARIVVKTTKCDQTAHQYAVSAQLDAAGYSVLGQITANDTQVQASAALKLGSETLIQGACAVNGKHLTDENYYNEDYDGHANIGKGEITLNLLSSVAIKLTADNSTQASRYLDYDGTYGYNEYYYEWLDEPQRYEYSSSVAAKAEVQRALNAINQYTNSLLYFANGGYTVPIQWELVNDEDIWEYNYGDGYSKGCDGSWDIQPLMAFNGSTYTFDSYFTDIRFSSLIDTFEQLVNDFEDLIE